MAITASQRSTGKLPTGAVCWIPALLTRISTLPSSRVAASTICCISAGLAKSAELKATRTPKSFAICARSRSIADASPKPFNMTSHPAPASARAMPRPMPLVDPVTIAAFPFKLSISPTRNLTFDLGTVVCGPAVSPLRTRHEYLDFETRRAVIDEQDRVHGSSRGRRNCGASASSTATAQDAMRREANHEVFD